MSIAFAITVADTGHSEQMAGYVYLLLLAFEANFILKGLGWVLATWVGAVLAHRGQRKAVEQTTAALKRIEDGIAYATWDRQMRANLKRDAYVHFLSS